MNKFFALFLSMTAMPLVANEKCVAEISTKESKWFATQYEAAQYCAPYKLLGCRVYNPEAGRWNSQIDFNEVFTGWHADYKTARKQAYQGLFNSLEGRGIYNMPFKFSLSFDCKNKY